MRESSNNAIVCDDMYAESINLHEAQGSRNDLMQSHSKATDSVIPPYNTVPEQTNDVITPTDTSNNMHRFDKSRVSCRGRMSTLFRRLMNSIESGFNHDCIAFQSTFETDHDINLELEEKMCNLIAFTVKMVGDITYFYQDLQQVDSDQFVDAVVKEVNGHVDNQSWELVKVEDVPKDATFSWGHEEEMKFHH